MVDRVLYLFKSNVGVSVKVEKICSFLQRLEMLLRPKVFPLKRLMAMWTLQGWHFGNMDASVTIKKRFVDPIINIWDTIPDYVLHFSYSLWRKNYMRSKLYVHADEDWLAERWSITVNYSQHSSIKIVGLEPESVQFTYIYIHTDEHNCVWS